MSWTPGSSRICSTAHCPDLEADVVSAGYRVGKTAPAALVALYEQVVGPYPAPANRRTWIVLRADPERTRKSALRRDAGVAGLARYLVASTTRIADHLASNGIDARCCAQLRRLRPGDRDQLRARDVVDDQGPQHVHRGLQRPGRPGRVVVGAGRSHDHAGADPAGFGARPPRCC